MGKKRLVTTKSKEEEAAAILRRAENREKALNVYARRLKKYAQELGVELPL